MGTRNEDLIHGHMTDPAFREQMKAFARKRMATGAMISMDYDPTLKTTEVKQVSENGLAAGLLCYETMGELLKKQGEQN